MRINNPECAFERFGYMAGRMVRFFMYSKHSMIRWASRVIMFSLLSCCFVILLSWFVGAILGVVSFALIMFVTAKGDLSVLQRIADDKSDSAPSGRNVFGRKLDSWGQVEDDLSVDDPFSPENINNPQYHPATHYNWNADED